MEVESLIEETKKAVAGAVSNSDSEYGDEESAQDSKDGSSQQEDYELNSESVDESEEDRRMRAKDKAHTSFKKKNKKFEINYTVGRIEDGNAILLSGDHNLIDVPLSLLPGNIQPGNILKFAVERNFEKEKKREAEIMSIQKQILEDPNFFANL